jgi:hypothetical protein
LSSTAPRGQRYLQKKFLLNSTAARTAKPMILRTTNDFNAKTEFRAIYGLSQADIPESLPQPSGRANRIVRPRKINRIFLLLTKIDLLTE